MYRKFLLLLAILAIILTGFFSLLAKKAYEFALVSARDSERYRQLSLKLYQNINVIGLSAFNPIILWGRSIFYADKKNLKFTDDIGVELFASYLYSNHDWHLIFNSQTNSSDTSLSNINTFISKFAGHYLVGYSDMKSHGYSSGLYASDIYIGRDTLDSAGPMIIMITNKPEIDREPELLFLVVTYDNFINKTLESCSSLANTVLQQQLGTNKELMFYLSLTCGDSSLFAVGNSNLEAFSQAELNSITLPMFHNYFIHPSTNINVNYLVWPVSQEIAIDYTGFAHINRIPIKMCYLSIFCLTIFLSSIVWFIVILRRSG